MLEVLVPKVPKVLEVLVLNVLRVLVPKVLPVPVPKVLPVLLPKRAKDASTARMVDVTRIHRSRTVRIKPLYPHLQHE